MNRTTQLCETLRLDRHGEDGATAVLTLTRAAKRNALDNATIAALERFFTAPDDGIRALVLAADGEHFSAGLDLSDLRERDPLASMEHSRTWHRAFAAIENGRVPVVAALKGAVIGGGLELACAAHIRVADSSAFYALPEGQRGLFVGGGGSVRIPRLIGVHRMTDLMLTGRVLSSQEGLTLGLSTYLVPEGEAEARALALAERISTNSPVTNFAVLEALPFIAEVPPAQGFLLESLMAAVSSSTPQAQERMKTFLEGRAAKVERQ